MDFPRSSGILLHISSLPGPFGIGDFGPAAYQFADTLAYADQHIWQVLPLVPVGYGYSPYASPSTFAGNPLFISPERLVDEGLLERRDLQSIPDFPSHQVAFEDVVPYKYVLLSKAYKLFHCQGSAADKAAFQSYCDHNQDWLDDYALFAVLKFVHEGAEWVSWSKGLRQRDPKALSKARKTHREGIEMQKFWQYLFDKQWADLKAYCNKKSIRIFGDLPIYVAHDSADVWANNELFFLDKTGRQTVVAGVPPDYFSENGQRWGNPIYRWDQMEKNGYAWWIRRFNAMIHQVDLIRLDHFRGFEAYWEVPASEETAVNGTWVKGPNRKLFDALEKALGRLPVIAENLGVITPEVTEIMEAFGYPGMAVLQFAFDGDASSEFLPHNYTQDLVAYTGTHDNDTLRGWWFNDSSTQDPAVKRRARQYAGDYLRISDPGSHDVHWAFNQALLASVAKIVVLPVQDVAGLDSDGRMNTPGTVGAPNWAWRMQKGMLNHESIERLKHLTHLYGRVVRSEE